MKRAPRSRQRHDLYAKYHDYDSEISDLLGECGFNTYLRGTLQSFLTDDSEIVATIEAINAKIEELNGKYGL